jgi:hypothetical protein
LNYNTLKTNTVQPLITKYGKAASLQRPGTSVGYTKTWNSGQGRYQWENDDTHVITYTDPAATPTYIVGKVLESKFEQNEIDGTTVMMSDRKFITSDLTDPTTADKLLLGATVLNIISVKSLQPGETDGVEVKLMWTLQCRA